MSISHGLANKQTGQERNDIPITLKRVTPSSFCFKQWMCDLQHRSKEWMIFITTALL
jgi:hypothetical protein